nr:hypothetical protein [uncultured Oscillibacter sp.]
MEVKTLKRKWARLCVVLLGLTVGFIALPVVMCELLEADLAVWGRLGLIGALGGIAAVTAVRYYCLRCPNCGRGMAAPQWKTGERRYCPCCGEPFVYDDELVK